MKVKFWKPDFNIARDLAQNLPALPTAVALSADGARAFVGDCQGTIRAYQTVDATAVGEIQTNPPAIATRLKELASVISKLETTVAESEKAKAVSLDGDRAALAGLLASRKRWTAASINTELLASRTEVETSTFALEQSDQQFSDTTITLGKAAEALNAARRDLVITHPESADAVPANDPAALQKRTQGVEKKLADALKSFREAELATLACRDKIDHTAPTVSQIISKYKLLQSAYQKSLE